MTENLWLSLAHFAIGVVTFMGPIHYDCVDRSSQSYVFHTSAEVNPTTSMMGGRVDGIRSQVAA